VRDRGDAITAEVAHFLCTPYPVVRRTPILLLLRMHEQARRIMRHTTPQG
jgi:hypothetical protein